MKLATLQRGNSKGDASSYPFQTSKGKEVFDNWWFGQVGALGNITCRIATWGI